MANHPQQIYHKRNAFWRIFLAVIGLTLAGLACSRTAIPSDAPVWQVPSGSNAAAAPTLAETPESAGLPSPPPPDAPILTPTPDSPHTLPAMRTEPEQYVVQPGDTLGLIAQRYGVTLDALLESNTLANPNLLEIGQVLTIPVPTPQGSGPGYKIIPDSELVYSPSNVGFDITAFIQAQGGYLASYHEEINEGEKELSGAEIVSLVATNYSVNPRLLLAILEHRSGWVTKANPEAYTLTYPIGLPDPWRENLYRQLTWTADQLNRGYYLWRVGGIGIWLLGDGSVVPIDPSINAGTAGVQQMYAPLTDRDEWEAAVTEGGVSAVYQRLFGYPFHYAIEPLLPQGLRQPVLHLPFEAGIPWAFTGGPHGAWDNGSAWAALDFAPPADALGCIPSNEWVTAMADGLIVRAENGAVVQDLDGDGYEATGWAILYMHIESRDRVQAGTYLQAGERIGHPSCEGGLASGTHVHVARKYNGEWIPADQSLPFVMDDWVSRGTGDVYDGFLENNGYLIEAYEGLAPENMIQR